MKTAPDPIRFAVIGAGRGKTFINAASVSKDIEMVAICDQNAEGLKPWEDNFTLRLYTGDDQVLNDFTVDAVTWSSITPLSEPSIAQGNILVTVPNFKALARNRDWPL